MLSGPASTRQEVIAEILRVGWSGRYPAYGPYREVHLRVASETKGVEQRDRPSPRLLCGVCSNLNPITVGKTPHNPDYRQRSPSAVSGSLDLSHRCLGMSSTTLERLSSLNS